jgi:D-alanyl-D-alanine endopeptidase (penicillin-binding protein 7)
MRIKFRAAVLALSLLGANVVAVDAVQAASSKKDKQSTVKAHARPAAHVRKNVHKVSASAAAISAESESAVRLQPRDQIALQSGAALVVDQSGAVIYQKNADVVAPIASITKLMTAMVVLDATPDLQETISISEEDIDTLRGSRSRLAPGASMNRETALLLALMSSENRAAHALARHYPGGLPAFIVAMNRKAAALGMKQTHFSDPTGLTSENVSTARDLSRMVEAAARYPLIREFSTTAHASPDVSGRSLVYNNTNQLVKSNSWEINLSKTGYIQEAGKCLVMQARVADKPVVIVLLDSVGKLTRIGDANRIKRWMESATASRRTITRA